MERSFIVSEESKYLKSYSNYIEMTNQQKKFVFDFLKEKEIEAKSYILRGDGFMNCSFDEYNQSDIKLSIDPTENDLIKFKKMLTKPSGSYNLCTFKKNSAIGKELAQRCVDEKVIINLNQPRIGDYFKSLEHGICAYSYQILPYNDKFYAKITSEYLKSDDTPEGFTEIELSEFLRINADYLDSEKVSQ